MSVYSLLLRIVVVCLSLFPTQFVSESYTGWLYYMCNIQDHIKKLCPWLTYITQISAYFLLLFELYYCRDILRKLPFHSPRGKSLLELWVVTSFLLARLTATLNLC